MSKRDLTVYIGRFSPFHLGHAEVVKQALQQSQRLLILIGSVNRARTIKDPWTFQERAFVIANWLVSETNAKVAIENQPLHGRVFTDSESRSGAWLAGSGPQVFIEPLHDEPYNDQLWINNVQRAVQACRPQEPVYLTGAKRDWTGWYLDMFPTFKKAFVQENARTRFDINATEIRSMYFEDQLKYFNEATSRIRSFLPDATIQLLTEFAETQEFNKLKREYQHIKVYKESWQNAPHKPTFMTTDAVVVQSGHVLFVKRRSEPGKGLWALPGGFVEQNERVFDGCIRELKQETRIKVPEPVLRGSCKAQELFDKPDRSLRGRTITMAYLFVLRDMSELPDVRGSDDAEEAKWFSIAEVENMEPILFEDHYAIVMTMLRQLPANG